MMRACRYHPLLVVLHWLLAALIVAALCVGFLVLAQTPNSDGGKIAVLRWHMAGGMSILALMVARLLVRLFSARPGAATTGHALLDRSATFAHYAFYVLVLLMVGSGFATALAADLPKIVFQQSGDPLPASFDVYPTFVAHACLATVFAMLIGIHVAAALYHHFALRDGLMRRMALGPRTVRDL